MEMLFLGVGGKRGLGTLDLDENNDAGDKWRHRCLFGE